MTLVCQGATAATRAAAFPLAGDALASEAVEALPRLRARLGWHGRALAAPSRAAQDTASALADAVDREPALRDCDYGAWGGRPMAEVESADPDAFVRWLSDPASAPHGGEPLEAVSGRVRGWLDTRAAAPSNSLVVLPPTVVRALVVTALDLPLSVFWRLDAAPLGLTRLTAQNGRWRLAAFNAAP